MVVVITDVFKVVDLVVLISCLVVFFRLVFLVEVDVEVVRVDVGVDVVVEVDVVVVVNVEDSVDVLASGMAVRNRIAELIV